MAERNSRMNAIVLTVNRQGEQNYSACMLSAELGIFYATLYGGAKSKKRALVQPFNSGLLYLYTDNSHHLRKINDFDVKNMHPSLRSNLYKMWAANLACEIILKTKCAGDYENAFALLSAFLDGIDASEETEARLGTIRFLWRYLGLLGVQPDPLLCVSCAQPLTSGVYTNASGGFICPDCLPSENESQHSPFHLNQESLSYLNAINTERPGVVRRLTLSAESARSIKGLVFYLIEQAAGCKLKSLESGMGIL